MCTPRPSRAWRVKRPKEGGQAIFESVKDQRVVIIAASSGIGQSLTTGSAIPSLASSRC